MTRKATTRKATLAKHLRHHGYITGLIWLGTYGMTNGLAQRVCDLRKDGWKISTLEQRDDMGKSMVRYILDRDPVSKKTLRVAP